MEQDKNVTANRTYKSSVFVMVFQEKKELLELYNAVSGKHYEDPEELEINTLENAIYMSIKNDLSFIIDSSCMNINRLITRIFLCDICFTWQTSIPK